MRAAVITAFDSPPVYGEYRDPASKRPGQRVVEVLASALSPLARAKASGAHYSSDRRAIQPPFVPGLDGVVRDADGRMLYTVLDDTAFGTMAERTLVETDRCVLLPAGTDPVQVAAALNPVMASWIALRYRVDFRPGSRVLVTGATGASGRAAITAAKLFGAGEVIAAGRNSEKLAALRTLDEKHRPDQVIGLDELAQASEVDVVLDFVWGPPTATGMVDLLTHRSDRGRELTWIEIGSVAGPQASLRAAALRSARLRLVGSGIGSVPAEVFRRELPQIVRAVADGCFDVDARAVPLAGVEDAWAAPTGTERLVFTP